MNLGRRHENLVLTRPDVIQDVHEAYFAAGADIIETDTFGANATTLKAYGMEALNYELNKAGAVLAREACDEYATPDKPRFVAGVLGPTDKTATISPDVNDPAARNISFDQLVSDYSDATRGLMDGGADLINKPLTHQTIAQVIGASRETVSRAMREFQDLRWVSTERRRIRLLDKAALRERAQQRM